MRDWLGFQILDRIRGLDEASGLAVKYWMGFERLDRIREIGFGCELMDWI